MQIEKPKPEVSTGLVLFVVVIALGIISLPFMTKMGIARKKSFPKRSSAPIQSQLPETVFPTTAPSPQIREKTSLVDSARGVPSVNRPESAVEPSLNEPSTLLTTFYGDVKVIGPNGTQAAKKNRQILKNETIEVGATGEAVLQIEELYVLRLKANTKLTQLEPKKGEVFSGKERVTYRFKLDQGSLLGTTKYRGDKINNLNLLVKDRVFDVQDSTFRVQLSDTSPWIGVLRGSVKSGKENNPSQNPFVIRALEKIPLTDTTQTVSAPVKISEKEWGLLRETYEMNQKSAQQEALEMDLRKRAGNFFDFVFDHGTFYTENVGYTVRDFYEDKASGEVYLEAEYDVFPSNSFVGLYVLTRDLDAKNYGGIRFQVRRKPEEGYPDRFYIEIKSKGQIMRRFEITDIKPDWENRQINFFTPISTPITEVTLVFLNENVGKSKKGFIQMREIQMIPLTGEQKAQCAEADKNPIPVNLPKSFPTAPRSLKQSVVTSPVEKAKKVVIDEDEKPVPYKTDSSQKIAQEVPKVVAFDDLS